MEREPMYWKKNRIVIIVALCLAVLVAGCRKDPETKKKEFVESADSLVKQEKYADAIIQYRNALKIDPNSSDIYYRLGDAYFKNQQLREAYASYKKSSELDKNNVLAQLAVGRFLLVTQQFNDVIQLGSDLLAKNPDNIDAALLVANGYAGKKDVAQGIKILQGVVAK